MDTIETQLELQEKQIELEQNYSNKFDKRIFKAAIKASQHKIFAKCLPHLLEHLDSYTLMPEKYNYTVKSGEVRVDEGLMEAHEIINGLLNRTDTDYSGEVIEDIWVDLYSMLLLKKKTTIQNCISIIESRLPEASQFYRKIRACNLLMESFCKAIGVQLENTKGETLMVLTTIPWNDALQMDFDKRGYTLPMITPPVYVDDINKSGYLSIEQTCLLGSKFNQHSYPLRFSHLNKSNRIEYEYESRLAEIIHPVFKSKPKPKDNGELETEEDIKARKVKWIKIMKALPQRLENIKDHTFYHVHAFDSRGRVSPRAYEFNYQSIKYLRSIQQLKRKEIIEPNF